MSIIISHPNSFSSTCHYENLAIWDVLTIIFSSLNIFICDLLNDTVTSLDYTAYNETMFNEWIRRSTKGSSHGHKLQWVTYIIISMIKKSQCSRRKKNFFYFMNYWSKWLWLYIVNVGNELLWFLNTFELFSFCCKNKHTHTKKLFLLIKNYSTEIFNHLV
jgi:hypothetical protein